MRSSGVDVRLVDFVRHIARTPSAGGTRLVRTVQPRMQGPLSRREHLGRVLTVRLFAATTRSLPAEAMGGNGLRTSAPRPVSGVRIVLIYGAGL